MGGEFAAGQPSSRASGAEVVSRANLDQRLGRLQQSRGDDLPLYVRRWLTKPLAADWHTIAHVERTRVPKVPMDASSFSPEAYAWLSQREPVA
ncbi:hypothetical protein CA236_00085 [Sphingomonas sp. ABOLG]|nr:hypothetical protein CA236_00085 [Sphingomonas sp. ABOLG]